MADSSDDVQPPARKKTCVALARNAEAAPSTTEDHAIVVGDCISAEAVKRSGLLSGIGSTSGLASLPSHISPADVKLWETACCCGYAEDIPTDELTTLVQVWFPCLADRAM